MYLCGLFDDNIEMYNDLFQKLRSIEIYPMVE